MMLEEGSEIAAALVKRIRSKYSASPESVVDLAAIVLKAIEASFLLAG